MELLVEAILDLPVEVDSVELCLRPRVFKLNRDIDFSERGEVSRMLEEFSVSLDL